MIQVLFTILMITPMYIAARECLAVTANSPDSVGGVSDVNMCVVVANAAVNNIFSSNNDLLVHLSGSHRDEVHIPANNFE